MMLQFNFFSKTYSFSLITFLLWSFCFFISCCPEMFCIRRVFLKILPVVLACPFVCPLVLSFCPLVVLAILSVCLFIADQFCSKASICLFQCFWLQLLAWTFLSLTDHAYFLKSSLHVITPANIKTSSRIFETSFQDVLKMP